MTPSPSNLAMEDEWKKKEEQKAPLQKAYDAGKKKRRFNNA